MSIEPELNIHLRLWTKNDLQLMERLLGDSAMMEYVGGPETPEQIRKRLERYCSETETRMFVIVFKPENLGIGSIGYWEREWQGQMVWESGWRVLPEYQGKGIATRALELAMERARSEHKYRFVHAFPSIANAPSNAICKKMGFVLQDEVDFEYPPGRFMRSNDWQLDLFALPDQHAGEVRSA